MNWVKKCKLLKIEAIQHNGQSCIELGDLLQVLHPSFDSAQDCQVDSQVLKEIPSKEIMK